MVVIDNLYIVLFHLDRNFQEIEDFDHFEHCLSDLYNAHALFSEVQIQLIFFETVNSSKNSCEEPQ